MKLLISMRERAGEDTLERKYISFFSNRGFHVVPVPNDVENLECLMIEADGFVLSGGGDVGKQKNRDKVEKRMLEFAIQNNIPVFGICRGMQFINCYFGGSLRKINHHVRKEHNVYVKKVLKNNTYLVNSFHDYSIDTLGKELEVFATTHNGEIEGIYNDLLLAVQWHPERMFIPTQLDENLINLFKKRIEERL